MSVRIIGRRGVTEPCRTGAVELLGSVDVFRLCLVVTGDRDSGMAVGAIIERLDGGMAVVCDGFAAGYSGEGPRGLADVMSAAAMAIASNTFVDLTRGASIARIDASVARSLYAGELNKQGIRFILARSVPLLVQWGSDPAIVADLVGAPDGEDLIGHAEILYLRGMHPLRSQRDLAYAGEVIPPHLAETTMLRLALGPMEPAQGPEESLGHGISPALGGGLAAPPAARVTTLEEDLEAPL